MGARPAPLIVKASLLLIVAGCGGGSRDSQLETVRVPDVMVSSQFVLAVNDSISLWYTLEREATATNDTGCIERGLEVRTGARRLLVPLFYTAERPVVLDDSTIQVPLYRHCRPEQLYRIHLRTGQPTPVRQESR